MDLKKAILKRVRDRVCPKRIRRGFFNAPELRVEDVFLISYPRSGNTWLRCILAHLLYDEGKIVCLRDLDRFVPDIHRGISDHNEYSIPRIIKTHRSYPLRHERDNPDLYHRNIYLVRHPFDVIRSYYHYQLYCTDSYVESNSLDQFTWKLLNGAVRHGSWQEHILSWKAIEKEMEIIFVRYEDLVQKPVETIIDIGQFLGLSLDSEDAKFANGKCSLEAMIELEKRGSLVEEDYSFVRRNHSKRKVEAELTEPMKRMIGKRFEFAMNLFHYDMK